MVKLWRERPSLAFGASSYYDLLNADNLTDVLAEQGRFALVEGRVLSVRESGATIYVNFGRRWTEDFTVTILKRNERNFTVAGLEPKKLAGRQIRYAAGLKNAVARGSKRRDRSK